jgi:phosphate transport system permease protein
VAPRRIAGVLGNLVDLLAAVPSVVYGLWGVAYLDDKIKPLSAGLHSALGWIPLFGDTGGRYGRSMLLASVVLAIMILPIVAALSREIFLQVPSGTREAAYALGATRWEMIRTAVLPFSRPGVTAAIMLGLGRALGETIAVALVLLSNFEISAKVLGPGGNTVAANIATKFAEYGPTGRGALIATGLVLFVITFVVNLAARGIVYRSARRFAAGT